MAPPSACGTSNLAQPPQGASFPGLSLGKVFMVEPGTLYTGLNNMPCDSSRGPTIK